MQNLEEETSKAALTVAVVAYSLCSSTMLLANKVAMVYLPIPSLVSVLQLVFAATVVFSLQLCNLTKVDPFEWDKIKPYAIYVCVFVCSIFANMRALRASNVETVVVARACTPLATSMIEYALLGRALPSLKSLASLLTVSLGAAAYCMADSQLGGGSYGWVVAYFFLITIEMTYGKSLTSSVKMDSVWGPVLYVNTLSILPMAMLGAGIGDFTVENYPHILNVSFAGWCAVLFSCITGTAIGYSAWFCRASLSATSFTLIGVINKFLTLLLNVAVWDKHSSPSGIAACCVCLMAGIFYEQAPKLETPSEPEDASDDDGQKLLDVEQGDESAS